MVSANNGDTVSVHYTGKLSDGTVFDSSTNADPIQFILGEGQVIPGFDEAIQGMAVGDKKTVVIPAEEAYGPHDADLVAVVDRDQIPEDLDPEIGQQLEVSFEDGGSSIVTITAVAESNVTLDANHPLAGKELTFELELVHIE